MGVTDILLGLVEHLQAASSLVEHTEEHLVQDHLTQSSEERGIGSVGVALCEKRQR